MGISLIVRPSIRRYSGAVQTQTLRMTSSKTLHICSACACRHSAIVWYFRCLPEGGREFLCGPKFRKLNLSERHQWTMLD